MVKGILLRAEWTDDTREVARISPPEWIELGELGETLGALQKAVGGLVECVAATLIAGDLDGWVNEEGLLLDMPQNPVARAIFRRPIVGSVVITRSDDNGTTISATEDDFELAKVGWLLRYGEKMQPQEVRA